jgi:hypothetical protein
VAERFVDKDTLLICRGCKWIGQASLWEPDDAPGRPSAKINLATATCLGCQRQGQLRVLRKRSCPRK